MPLCARAAPFPPPSAPACGPPPAYVHAVPPLRQADAGGGGLGTPARPATGKKELLTLITELPHHPDVIPGLTALQKAGFRVVTLTNSPETTVQKQMAYAGLTGFFEQLLSSDSLQRYKPHPDTYHSICNKLKMALAQTMLVAAHG